MHETIEVYFSFTQTKNYSKKERLVIKEIVNLVVIMLLISPKGCHVQFTVRS